MLAGPDRRMIIVLQVVVCTDVVQAVLAVVLSADDIAHCIMFG